MHINTDKKSVYLHVMKTGGTSLYKMLGSPKELLQRAAEPIEMWEVYTGMHGSYRELLKNHPDVYEKIKDYYKFTFVRNPWDHAMSLYFHVTKSSGFNSENHFGSNNRQAKIEDYKDFNYYLRFLYKPQSLLTFQDPSFMNDDYCYFENFNNEVKRLFKTFGYSNKAFNSQIKHENKSSTNMFGMEYPSNYKQMYDQEGIDIITDMCKDYIEAFNYQY